MSTKCSLACGDNFHLYAECFDDKNVYLEVEGVEFEVEGVASAGRVMVSIPLEIWEVVRGYSNINLSLVDKTDSELTKEAEKFVEDRMAKCEAAKAQGHKTGLVALLGSMTYGSADDPPADQIKRGFDNMVKDRKEQQELREKIRQLAKSQRPAYKAEITTMTYEAFYLVGFFVLWVILFLIDRWAHKK